MIFIVVKFNVKPEWSDRWIENTRAFTEATRSEPGNLWFDWSRSNDDPEEFVLVQAFADDAADTHVHSEHFAEAMRSMPQALVRTPRIVSQQVEQDGWGEMRELTVA